MDTVLYILVRTLIALVQALPLRWVARLGRAGGGLAYWLDARHRRVALNNLTMCFGKEKTAVEIRALARENFRRIGENFASAVRTAAMTWEELRPHLEFVGDLTPLVLTPDGRRRVAIGAVGHFGNFELYALTSRHCPGQRSATTYRSLRPPALDRALQSLRTRSDCLYFERRSGAAALREALSQSNISLGLLADQNAGRAGVQIPFMGHDCSTSVAPAVYALRYNCPIFIGVCYRVGLAKWRIEFGPFIPTRENDRPRDKVDIMRDVNREFEIAVRRDPANWFWVHNRWKKLKPRPAAISNRKSQIATSDPLVEDPPDPPVESPTPAGPAEPAPEDEEE